MFWLPSWKQWTPPMLIRSGKKCAVNEWKISFLINFSILFYKFTNTTTIKIKIRKAVRATLILIPLLGLHFILTPFRPETNDSAARAYEFFSAIVSSLQVNGVTWCHWFHNHCFFFFLFLFVLNRAFACPCCSVISTARFVKFKFFLENH